MASTFGFSYTRAFAEPDAGNIIDAIHPATNLGLWSGETLEQIRLRYPRAEIVNMDDWMDAKAARQNVPVIWDETTEDEYMQMLECLPPAFWNGDTFAVGELDDHDARTGAPRFRAYRKTGERCFRSSRPMTVKELRAVAS